MEPIQGFQDSPMAKEMASLAPCTAPSAWRRNMGCGLGTSRKHRKFYGNPWLFLENVLEMVDVPYFFRSITTTQATLNSGSRHLSSSKTLEQ